MLTSDIERYLSQGLSLMALSLDNQHQALARLALYFHELKKWNRRINLVARSMGDQQILESHFLDSLTLLSLLPTEKQPQETILDVGTGAGFPGLVLKAACPALSVTLIEPRENRFFFLKHTARVLQLKGVEMLNIRLEEKGGVKELSGRQFSFITTRAFSDTWQFIELTGHYLKKGGRIIMMKGPGAIRELDHPLRKVMAQKFLVSDVKKFYLPFSRKERLLFSIKGSEEKGQ